MVRRTNNRRSRKTNRRRRPQPRAVHKAVGMRLLRATVPADPPVRPLTHEHSAVIRIDCVTGDQSGITSYGSFGVCASASIKQKDSLSITPEDIRKLIVAYMGYVNDSLFEICVKKVSVWGSRLTSSVSEQCPKLAVDISDISGGLLVTDRGTPMTRPKMGVLCPFNIWLKPTNIKIIRYYPEIFASDGQCGVIDISVTWRRFAL